MPAVYIELERNVQALFPDTNQLPDTKKASESHVDHYNHNNNNLLLLNQRHDCSLSALFPVLQKNNANVLHVFSVLLNIPFLNHPSVFHCEPTARYNNNPAVLSLDPYAYKNCSQPL